MNPQAFRRRAALGAAFLLALVPGAQEEGAGRASDLERLGEALGRQALAEGAHGLAFCVDVEGELAYAGGFGFVDDTRTVRADADARFRAGALLPTFLSVAALQLAERGLLDLDAPLTAHLPGLYPAPPVRVDQLLTHTSGVPSYVDRLESEQHLAQPLDPERVLAWLATGPRESAPGACASYSPTNDFLLGRVLAAVAKREPRVLLEEAVFAPAGMEDTAWCTEGPQLFPRAPVEQDLAEGFRDERGAPAPFEAEALCSSARDLVRFQRALVEGKLLSEASSRLRATPAELTDGSRSNSARGIALSALDELVAQSAGGGMAGYRVHLAYYPGLDATVVVLGSGVDVPARAMGASLARVLFARVRPEARDLPLDPAVRPRYVGEYYAGCTSYSIAEAGMGLALFHPSGTRHPLRYQGGEGFVSAVDPELSLSFELEGGRVTVLVLTDHGVTLRAKRVS